MGNNEDRKSSKTDKSALPAPSDQPNNVHVYPDWAAMQAYYGPRVVLPAYYNTSVASGPTPHSYMWGPPQPMIPPYGGPYAAVYSHGGVYAHHAVPFGTAPPSVETPTKSSGNKDGGLMKELKGFDGLAMSNGNDNGNAGTADSEELRLSQSVETEGSSDGSNGNSPGRKKRSCDGPSVGGDDTKAQTLGNGIPAMEATGSSDKISGATAAPSNVSAKTAGPVTHRSVTSSLEPKTHVNANAAKTSPTSQQTCVVVPSKVWVQNERELKQERRKQSNRESARRSRLRKQAEIEELAHKVTSLTAENKALKTEINEVAKKSENLKLENAALMDKLNGVQLGHIQKTTTDGTSNKRATTDNTENLLSRINNFGNVEKNREEGDVYERKSNVGAKLHKLLDAGPRSDAVAAG